MTKETKVMVAAYAVPLVAVLPLMFAAILSQPGGPTSSNILAAIAVLWLYSAAFWGVRLIVRNTQ